MQGVEIRHLAALETVVELGSFARAAARLGYSQSAVSQQLAALERAAGMRLVERPGGRRPVTPTDAGERLLRHGRRAVAAMRAAEADLTALAQGEAGTLRVGAFPSAGVRLLPPALRLLRERQPGIEIGLVEADYEADVVDLLLAGEVEVAFVLGAGDPALEHLELLEDPYVLVVPAGSELAGRDRPVRPRELARLPLVAYRRWEDGGEAALRRLGLEPSVVFRSDESAIVQALVATGIGNALVPRLTVDLDDPEIVALPVASIPPRAIAIAWHADRPPSRAATEFVAVVEEVAADLRATLSA